MSKLAWKKDPSHGTFCWGYIGLAAAEHEDPDKPDMAWTRMIDICAFKGKRGWSSEDRCGLGRLAGWWRPGCSSSLESAAGSEALTPGGEAQPEPVEAAPPLLTVSQAEQHLQKNWGTSEYCDLVLLCSTDWRKLFVCSNKQHCVALIQYLTEMENYLVKYSRF